MLQSLRVIASITTDLHVVVSTIAICVLLFRLLRTCMLSFRLLPLAYPVSFIAHLLLPFRPLFTTASSNSSIHLLLTIFNYAVIWLGKDGFLSHVPIFMPGITSAVCIDLRGIENQILHFRGRFWQFLRLSGFDFCLRYSLREYIVLRYIANEWKMANSRTIGSSFSFEQGIFPKFSAR